MPTDTPPAEAPQPLALAAGEAATLGTPQQLEVPPQGGPFEAPLGGQGLDVGAGDTCSRCDMLVLQDGVKHTTSNCGHSRNPHGLHAARSRQSEIRRFAGP